MSGREPIVDPSEYEEFEAAIKDYEEKASALDEAFVRLVQAAKRIVLIRKLREGPPKTIHKNPSPPMTTLWTGKFCQQCGNNMVAKRGGGCISCPHCHWEEGCNG